MKTFEEGEWLAFDADMWLVKSVEPNLQYNISNGAVETWVSPNRHNMYKLTLSVKNAVDAFQKRKSYMHSITPPGFNWPDVHRAYVEHFNGICDLLEKYEKDYENKTFQKEHRKLWDEFEEFHRSLEQSVNGLKKQAFNGIPLMRP